jgi:cleavage and polyadenylation specificity factor subunit 1
MDAVLQQRVQNAWQPLAFFSRKQKYSVYDRELLAIYEAVKHFRHFIIFTDHKPITYAFQQKRDKCSPRQFNHLDYISQLTADIRLISEQRNVVAEALSRVEAISAPVSHDALASAQEADNEFRALLQEQTALRLEKLSIPGTTAELYCDTATGKPRQYIPAPLRRQVFHSVHDLSHPGTKATAKLVLHRFVWPGIQKDCRAWARTCQPCQRSKVSRHTAIPLGDFTLPAARFLQVHLDLISWIHVLPHGSRPLHTLAGSHASTAGVGNLFSAKGHLDIYNIIRGPFKFISLKISLLYLVKHLINSPLM